MSATAYIAKRISLALLIGSAILSVGFESSIALAQQPEVRQPDTVGKSEQIIKQTQAALPLQRVDYSASYAADVTLGSTGFALLPNLAHAVNILKLDGVSAGLADSGNAVIKDAWLSTSVSKPMTTDEGYKIIDVDFHGLGAQRTALFLNSFRLPVYPFARDQLSMSSSLGMLPNNALESFQTVSGQSTALNGPGAIGGSINAKLKSGEDGKNFIYHTSTGLVSDGNPHEDSSFLLRFKAGRVGILFTSEQVSTSSLQLLGSEYGNDLLAKYPNFHREVLAPGSLTWNIKPVDGEALTHQFYLGEAITANGITYDGTSSILNTSDEFYNVANLYDDGSYTSKTINRFTQGIASPADIPLVQNLNEETCTSTLFLVGSRYDSDNRECYRDLTQFHPYLFGADKENQLLALNIPLNNNRGLNMLYMDNREDHLLQVEHPELLDSGTLSSLPINGDFLAIDQDITLTGNGGYLRDPVCASSGFNVLINGSSRAPNDAYFLQGIENPTAEQLELAANATALYQNATDADASLVCHFGLTDLLNYENAIKSWKLDGTLDALDYFRTGGFEQNIGSTSALGFEYFGQTTGQSRYLANFMYESSSWSFTGHNSGLNIANLYLAQNGTYGGDCLAADNLDENDTIINTSLCADTFDYYFNPNFPIGAMTFTRTQVNDYSKFSHKFSYDMLLKSKSGDLIGNHVFGWDFTSEDFSLAVDEGTQAAGCTPLGELNSSWLENQVCVMPWGTFTDRGTIKPGSGSRLIFSPFYEMRRTRSNGEWQLALRLDVADDYSLPSIDFNYRWDQNQSARWYFNTSFGGSLPSMTQHIGGVTDTWFNADVDHRIIMDTQANSQLKPETSFSQSVKYQMQRQNFFVSSEFWFTQLNDVLMAPTHIALMQAWENLSCAGQAVSQVSTHCSALMNWVYPKGLNEALSSDDVASSTLPGYDDIIYVRSQVINGPGVTSSGINFNAGLLLTNTWNTWLTFAGQLTLLAEQDALVFDGIPVSSSSNLAGSVNSLNFANPMHDLFLNAAVDMTINAHQLHINLNYTTDLKDDRTNATLSAFNTLNFKYNWRVPGDNATFSVNVNNILKQYPALTSAGAGFWSFQGLPTGTEYQFKFTYEL